LLAGTTVGSSAVRSERRKAERRAEEMASQSVGLWAEVWAGQKDMTTVDGSALCWVASTAPMSVDETVVVMAGTMAALTAELSAAYLAVCLAVWSVSHSAD
jgi:hypothetical protein